jgi:hypothetical protein
MKVARSWSARSEYCSCPDCTALPRPFSGFGRHADEFLYGMFSAFCRNPMQSRRHCGSRGAYRRNGRDRYGTRLSRCTVGGLSTPRVKLA